MLVVYILSVCITALTIHTLFGKMKALERTFCARYVLQGDVLQGDVYEFELGDEEVEYLTKMINLKYL